MNITISEQAYFWAKHIGDRDIMRELIRELTIRLYILKLIKEN